MVIKDESNDTRPFPEPGSVPTNKPMLEPGFDRLSHRQATVATAKQPQPPPSNRSHRQATAA